MGEQSPGRGRPLSGGLKGFAQRASGLLLPKRAQSKIEKHEQAVAAAKPKRFKTDKTKRGVIPARVITGKRGITQRPASSVKAENRRRNKVAAKSRHRNRVNR